jgi:aminopeptidase
MPHAPSREQLERYADLVVNFALGGGEGISRGDVVRVVGHESAKPLYAEVCRAVWKAGGHVIGDYRPDDDSRTCNLTADFYALADDGQISFFPAAYHRGVLDQADHLAYIDSTVDPKALSEVAPAKLIAHQQAHRPLVEWQTEKESQGRFSWTIVLYGTEQMASEARLSLEEYWEQIVVACFLDSPDPKVRWREVVAQMREIIDGLNALPIDRLHIEGEDADLWITLGEKRRWIGGGGRNIPSFEIFTSPDWRGTEGRIRFSEPLYVYGTLLTGIELEFAGGVVTRASAAEGEELLLEMLRADGANRIGEFSLTDARLSRITKFMAETLYDENVGGPYGNTHIAVGKSLQHCYDGDPARVDAREWERLGFNESVVHTDIVSTTDRTVTAVLRDGSERTIYAGGRFAVT